MNRDLLVRTFDLFTRITTMVFLFSGIFIAVFWNPSAKIQLSYIFAVIILSLVLSVFHIPLDVDEKMSKRKTVILNILFFCIVNVSVAVIGFYLEWFNLENKAMLAGFEITILAVYFGATAITWFFDRNVANKMNDRLKEISAEL